MPATAFGHWQWKAGLPIVGALLIAVIAPTAGRWEEPLAKESKGVHRHSDGRPLLGRKIAHKSEREMADLGLAIDGK